MLNNKPLTQSGVADWIWDLYHTDQEAFRREVEAHFALGYPGFTPVQINLKRKIIWLRDDRR